MLPDDLPQDFLEFNARFGTDEQCREYLFRARWPGARRPGGLRLAVGPDPRAASLEGFLGAAVARPTAVATDGWSGYAGLAAEGYAHEPAELSAAGARRRSRRPA